MLLLGNLTIADVDCARVEPDAISIMQAVAQICRAQFSLLQLFKVLRLVHSITIPIIAVGNFEVFGLGQCLCKQIELVLDRSTNVNLKRK